MVHQLLHQITALPQKHQVPLKKSSRRNIYLLVSIQAAPKIILSSTDQKLPKSRLGSVWMSIMRRKKQKTLRLKLLRWRSRPSLLLLHLWPMTTLLLFKLNSVVTHFHVALILGLTLTPFLRILLTFLVEMAFSYYSFTIETWAAESGWRAYSALKRHCSD